MRRSMCFLMFAVSIVLLMPAAVLAIDVYRDAYILDYDDTTGIADGVPNSMEDTNSLQAGTGTLLNGKQLESRLVMTFDVSPFWGASLSSATLRAAGRSLRLDGQPINLTIYSYSGDADNGEVTLDDYSRSASLAGTASLPNFGSWSSASKVELFEVDVKQALQDALDNHTKYLEFRGQAQDLQAYVSAGAPFCTDSSWVQGAIGPVLTFEVAPEPVSSALFLLGAGAIGARMLRRRKR